MPDYLEKRTCCDSWWPRDRHAEDCDKYIPPPDLDEITRPEPQLVRATSAFSEGTIRSASPDNALHMIKNVLRDWYSEVEHRGYEPSECVMVKISVEGHARPKEELGG